MSATAGQAGGVQSPADRLGVEPSSVVMEIGTEDDADEALRDAVRDRCSELVDADTDEVVDIALLWWREDDGDLVEALIDASFPLAENGVIWVLTPKAGHDGHTEPSEVNESALTAGLQQTTSINAAKDWTGTRLVRPRGGRGKR